MAEAANVRLVLCPKCEELLPELPEFSLYKCGGCGAVLQAKGKGILENGHPKLPDDAKVGGANEKVSIVKVSEVSIALDKQAADNGVETGPGDEMRSSSQHETSVRVSDSYRKGIGKEGVDFRGIADSEYSQDSLCNKKQAKNCEFNVDRPEYAYFDENVGDLRNPMESMKSRPATDRWDDRSFESGPSRMHTTRGMSGQVRINDFLCHEDGLSSGDMRPCPEQAERARYQGYNSGAVRPENLEIDRMDLLRKLDELRDQLSRSNDVAASPVCCRRNNASYPESLSNSQALNNQPLVPDEMGPHCFSHSSKFAPCTTSYVSRPQDCTRRGCAHETPLFSDHFRNERHWRSSCHPQHMQQAYDHRFPHYYGEDIQDLYLPRRHENLFRQETCSCRNCCGKSQKRSPVIGQQFCDARNQHNVYPTVRGTQATDSGDSRFRSLNHEHHWNSNELESSHYPRRMVVAHGNKQVSLPIAGGAPFITCYNCFELVKLPRKYISTVKKPQKVKCGACSSIIFFEIGSRDIVAPISAHGDQIPTEIDDGSIDTTDENVGYWNDGFYGTIRNTLREDFTDSQHKFSEADKKDNSCDFEGPLNHLSSTSILSQEDDSPDNRLSSLRGTHLSPCELSDNGHDNIIENRFDKGTRSRGSEEVASLDRNTSLQKSTEDHAMASEIDVPSNELTNGYASQDSADTNKEYQPKASKGVESFLSNLMKKSFKDFKKSNHDGEVRESQVFVNGHPLTDRAVKKAEKLSGPIQPGEYWYDSKAGFWGVMGHPCLGIIMPSIEEFNHPMPVDCAGGNTAVYVNGRELHQKDLDLLASRGLPITRNRSYLIEINGEVTDEQTGEALDGLGKLAPTVERAKHGFGMKVPRFITQTQS